MGRFSLEFAVKRVFSEGFGIIYTGERLTMRQQSGLFSGNLVILSGAPSDGCLSQHVRMTGCLGSGYRCGSSCTTDEVNRARQQRTPLPELRARTRMQKEGREDGRKKELDAEDVLDPMEIEMPSSRRTRGCSGKYLARAGGAFLIGRRYPGTGSRHG